MSNPSLLILEDWSLSKPFILLTLNLVVTNIHWEIILQSTSNVLVLSWFPSKVGTIKCLDGLIHLLLHLNIILQSLHHQVVCVKLNSLFVIISNRRYIILMFRIIMSDMIGISLVLQFGGQFLKMHLKRFIS